MLHRRNPGKTFVLALAACVLGACDEPVPPAQGAPAAPAAPAAMVFEPARFEVPDLAIGETREQSVALVATADQDWSGCVLRSSCDCLSAEFGERREARRADVVVRLFGVAIETIEGVITLEDAAAKPVARLIVPLTITRRPFVQPRVVEFPDTPSGECEFVLGQAFAPEATLPDSMVDTLAEAFFEFDASKVQLVDLHDHDPERSAEHVILRSRFRFALQGAARAKRFEVVLPATFGVPPQALTATLRWPGPPEAPKKDD